MLRKIFISGLSLLLIATLVYAAGSILNVSVNDKNQTLSVEVSVDNQGAWLGCSIYANRRKDFEPFFVVGKDSRVFKIPSGATSYEVALWRKRYDKGEGPDKDNAWGRANGYYLWEELDRKTGSF